MREIVFLDGYGVLGTLYGSLWWVRQPKNKAQPEDSIACHTVALIDMDMNLYTVQKNRSLAAHLIEIKLLFKLPMHPKTLLGSHSIQAKVTNTHAHLWFRL